MPRSRRCRSSTPHAAGIDVGDATHWVCVDATPDGSDTVREFPAHTPGLRDLVDWLRQCGVTTVALEASGVYGHVLFLTLLEAGFDTIMTAPQFARQIKGRPKTDRRDCQWIQRLHRHGLLPTVFQPDEATHTLRDYVRQRANLVRLSGQHIQRMQKALVLMNLKLTQVLGDVTGVTGLKIIRAILAGERDPHKLAELRDRRCKHTQEEIATALDGRYRPEHVTELRCCFVLWEKYQEVIAELDTVIAAQLQDDAARHGLAAAAAQGGGAADAEITQCLLLYAGEMPAVATEKRLAILSNHVRHFPLRPRDGGRSHDWPSTNAG